MDTSAEADKQRSGKSWVAERTGLITLGLGGNRPGLGNVFSDVTSRGVGMSSPLTYIDRSSLSRGKHMEDVGGL